MSKQKKEGTVYFGSLVIKPETPAAGPDDEEADEFNDDGVLFWVNKSGFPINDKTWERMWNHVSKIHPDGQKMVTKIRKADSLPEIPVPQPPLNFPSNASVPEKLDLVQKYMNELQYNHTGTQFFEIRKNRPISGLMDSAKEMIREALPIKCLEAVILALYLTNGIAGLDRFPVSFKTSFQGSVHRHVVLGVYYSGRYGALGMSRRQDLMYKPLIFKNLSSLVVDFEQAYKKYWHEVKKVKIGLPASHDAHSYEHIIWKHITMNIAKLVREDMCRELDKHAKEMRAQLANQGKASLLLETSPKKAAHSQSPGLKKESKSVSTHSFKSNKGSGTPSKRGGEPLVKKSNTVIPDTRTPSNKDSDAVAGDAKHYQVRV